MRQGDIQHLGRKKTDERVANRVVRELDPVIHKAEMTEAAECNLADKVLAQTLGCHDNNLAIRRRKQGFRGGNGSTGLS